MSEREKAMARAVSKVLIGELNNDLFNVIRSEIEPDPYFEANRAISGAVYPAVSGVVEDAVLVAIEEKVRLIEDSHD